MPQDILGIEIFAVGTWNGMKFVQEDLRQIADNTNALMAKGTSKPPLKLGHAEQDGLLYPDEKLGQPALGWMENLRVVADKLIADFRSVPDIVVEAVKQRRYRQLSIEMDYLKHMGWRATGLALLGADLPVVKTLNDLQAYLSASGKPGESGFHLAAAEPMIGGAPVQPRQLQSQRQSMAEENSAELLERANQRIKQFEAKERMAVFGAAKAAAMKPYNDAVASGRLTPAIRDKIEGAFTAQEATFSEAVGLNLPPAIAAEMLASPTLPTQTAGKPSANDPPDPVTSKAPDVAFAEAANRIMFERKISYTEAAKVAEALHPELQAAYHKQPFHAAMAWVDAR